MERRFKLALVSKHDIINHGENFEMVLKDSLPSNVKILSKHDDYLTGSMAFLLYCDDWELAEEGAYLERIGIELKESIIERI